MVEDFCLLALGVVADVCCWSFHHLGLLLINVFAHTCYLLRLFFFYLGTHNHRPILTSWYPRTHFARVFRWHASLHIEMLVGGGWCWLDNVQRCPLRKWLHFGNPGKSNTVLPFDFVLNPVWELHISAATRTSLLFSVASTTNLVGHDVFTSFVDLHKNTNF